MSRGARPETLWTARPRLDRRMLEYTIGEDRTWDGRILRWDVLGSLGHVEGLRASRLITAADYRRLRGGLRAALAAVDASRLTIGPQHEDAHSAVEAWLTRREPGAGERVHTGRSRNDQIACDLRLYLKDRLLAIHGSALDLVLALLAFARRYRTALWPGYTHQRRAMPSSAGLWAAGYAAGLLDSVESLAGVWPMLDRSPLGSAAGYGVPLRLRREAAARALGFGAVEPAVAAVQNGRGKLEAAALFWCAQLGHDAAKLSADVALFAADEYGYLVLPPDLATGSSIMPHKRNPDLFELSRARAAAVDADLIAVLRIKAGLPGGYHRDFQLLKEPLLRGVERTAELLGMLAHAIPRLGVDRVRGAAALDGGLLATDEVMRRVESGTPFRTAYRDVAAALAAGERFAKPSSTQLLARRKSTGGLGNLGLPALASRSRSAARWARRERARFDRSMRTLAGGAPRRRPRARR
jgi:argininosuccinate lyase